MGWMGRARVMYGRAVMRGRGVAIGVGGGGSEKEVDWQGCFTQLTFAVYVGSGAGPLGATGSSTTGGGTGPASFEPQDPIPFGKKWQTPLGSQKSQLPSRKSL